MKKILVLLLLGGFSAPLFCPKTTSAGSSVELDSSSSFEVIKDQTRKQKLKRLLCCLCCCSCMPKKTNPSNKRRVIPALSVAATIKIEIRQQSSGSDNSTKVGCVTDGEAVGVVALDEVAVQSCMDVSGSRSAFRRVEKAAVT